MNNIDERMKMYEAQMAHEVCMPLIPVLVRLDGKNFHKYTKGFTRPFDVGFHDAMVETTRFLVEEANTCCGYTQSDEITLLFYKPEVKSQIFMGGRVQKLVSILASIATWHFYWEIAKRKKDKEHEPAFFDCRVWQVPTLVEAANVFVWREQDAARNSVSMAAQHYFSHKQLQGKSTSEMQEMLFQVHNINWNNYPVSFKRGTYVQRRKRARRLEDWEWEKIPPKHRPPREQLVERTEVKVLDMPKLTTITNRVDVLVNGVDPIIGEE